MTTGHATSWAGAALGALVATFLCVSGSFDAAQARPAHDKRSAARRALDAEMGIDDWKRVNRSVSPAFLKCVETSNGSTAPLRDCAYTEHKRLDEILNHAYKVRMAALTPDRGRKLRMLERDWLKRRRHFCTVTYLDPQGGTKELLALDDCYLSSTVARTRFIETFR